MKANAALGCLRQLVPTPTTPTSSTASLASTASVPTVAKEHHRRLWCSSIASQDVLPLLSTKEVVWLVVVSKSIEQSIHHQAQMMELDLHARGVIR
jgi:hypothetical protein